MPLQVGTTITPMRSNGYISIDGPASVEILTWAPVESDLVFYQTTQNYFSFTPLVDITQFRSQSEDLAFWRGYKPGNPWQNHGSLGVVMKLGYVSGDDWNVFNFDACSGEVELIWASCPNDHYISFVFPKDFGPLTMICRSYPVPMGPYVLSNFWDSTRKCDETLTDPVPNRWLDGYPIAAVQMTPDQVNEVGSEFPNTNFNLMYENGWLLQKECLDQNFDNRIVEAEGLAVLTKWPLKTSYLIAPNPSPPDFSQDMYLLMVKHDLVLFTSSWQEIARWKSGTLLKVHPSIYPPNSPQRRAIIKELRPNGVRDDDAFADYLAPVYPRCTPHLKAYDYPY